MKPYRIFSILAVGFLASIPNSRAQTLQGQGSPSPNAASTTKTNDAGAVPAARGVSPAQSDDAYNVTQAQPDTHALSGAEMLGLGLGSLQHSRNIIDVGLSLNESGGNVGILNSTGQSDLGSLTMFSGTLNFNHVWSHYQLTGFYYGGDSLVFPSPNGQGQNWFQDVGIEQTMNWRRLVLHIYDDFTASPEASFGGQGLGGPGLLGQSIPQVPLGTIGSSFNPIQSILTGHAMRLDNTVLAQADYLISRRSTITFSASYDFLHFLTPGYIDDHSWNLQAGYDHSISPANSIGFTAGYSRFSYVGTGQAIETDSFSALFGRRITSRMAFQISGGPLLLRQYNFIPPTSPRWTWSLNAALRYEWRRAGYSLSYVHNTTPGSGVLFGAQADTFTASAHRSFTRFWTLTVNAADAYNKGLVSSGSAASNFNNWYGGVNLDHQVGRHVYIGLNYGIQKQNTNANSCPVISCGGTSLMQIGGVSFTWHTQPIVLD